MINSYSFQRVDKSSTHSYSTPKGIKSYTVTTILTYKTPDGYTGSIVKITEHPK